MTRVVRFDEIMKSGVPGITIATFLFIVVSSDIGIDMIIVNSKTLLTCAALFAGSSIIIMFNYLFSSNYKIEFDNTGEKIAGVFFGFGTLILFIFGVFWVLVEYDLIG